MTEADVEHFVARLVAAWAAGDSKGFRDVWHPDGVLHHVLLDRERPTTKIPRLHCMQIAAAPDVRWTTAGGAHFVWRGVDALRLKDGKTHGGTSLCR